MLKEQGLLGRKRSPAEFLLGNGSKSIRRVHGFHGPRPRLHGLGIFRTRGWRRQFTQASEPVAVEAVCPSRWSLMVHDVPYRGEIVLVLAAIPPVRPAIGGCEIGSRNACCQ